MSSKYGRATRTTGCCVDKEATRNGLLGYAAVLLTVLLVFFMLFIYGAHQTTQTMRDMHDATEFMKNQTMEMPKMAARYISYLSESYPEGYDRVVLNEVTNTISNSRQITARALVLLNNLEPENLMSLVSKVDSITTQVNEIVSNTDKEQTADVINRITSVLGGVDDILATVPSQDVRAAVVEFTSLAAHVNHLLESMETNDFVTQFTNLVENTNAIEQKIREMHELRVSLP